MSPSGAAWAGSRPSTRSQSSACRTSMTLSQQRRRHPLRDLQGKMIAHCEHMGDRMAIIDTPPDLRAAGRAGVAPDDRRLRLQDGRAVLAVDGGHGPDHAPADHGAAVGSHGRRVGSHRRPARGPQGAGERGHHGRHRAGLPGHAGRAGRAEPDRDQLHSLVPRAVASAIWGARTLSSDPEWRYINVRRLFNYVAESIIAGTQWSVFEPNDSRLWMQLKIAASNFLMRVWRDGALFGATPGRRSTSNATRRRTRRR